jgi:PKD repeat protein
VYTTQWGSGWGSGRGQFARPGGIAVDSAGSVYVADTGNNRIQKFAPEDPLPVPPSGNVPKDLNDDGLYEDINGNGLQDFNDVVIFFNQMDWIAGNESVGAFDFNKNGRIDFNDIVMVFNTL